MSATMMDQGQIRTRVAAGEGSAGAGFHLRPGRVVAYAWLLAIVPIGFLQLVHTDLHEHRELPPLLHWLRDAALAVPFAAVAVILAALLVARLRRAEPGRRGSMATTVAWGLLAALLFAVLSIPGNQLHGFLFGAEEEAGVSLLQDLATDAFYALVAALEVIVPLALLAGVPWRGARRATTSRQPAQGPVAALAAADGPFESPATAGTTTAGGDR